MKRILILVTLTVLVAVLVVAAIIFFNRKNIWIEEGKRGIYIGTYQIGVRYSEIDLSKPAWDGRSWDEQGFACEPRSDLTQILGEVINTRDEAAHIAKKIRPRILASSSYELLSVRHDPNMNIWIFGYAENNIKLRGSTFSVAVDGNSGELIRMWVT